ncbi:LON peptidase N-terminal domain and RING finger protein 2-like isoform X1 [Triplophysa rosa]|uniref:LON peptidase N-terminal domain and RING finger protein 2-like isoform X1 n=2 Tax=Triplophysa rosa TaxID=992332 RepID=UPI002545CC54|nr:LON peptidase N-terminal domain and RING finger protein 2-like isoform X1 [Triplophysa rosa]
MFIWRPLFLSNVQKMDAGIQNHTEHYVHGLSNPSSAGLCAEMLGVADEACSAGDFELAVEIYSSQLAELQHTDRGLCLRKADALARGGRISEALDSYRIAANIQPLSPDELQVLVDVIALTIRVKEQSDLKNLNLGNGCFESDELEEEQNLNLFSCRLCKCLLTEPTTLVCGHTFCKRCLEEDAVKECKSCCVKTTTLLRKFNVEGLRVNVIVSGLIDKWFHPESHARRCWLEGESLWKEDDLSSAIQKFNKAEGIAPFICRLLARRAELHMEMKNFSQAIQDGDTICRLRPLWPKAHYIKATAFRSIGQSEDALREYLYCVALKADWITVKLDAQKILSDMFTSVFVNDGLGTSQQPLLAGSSPRVKPSSLLSSLHSPLYRDGDKAGSSKESSCSKFQDGSSSFLNRTENNVNSIGISSVSLALKRKWTEDPNDFQMPNKQRKRDEALSFKSLPTLSEERQVPLKLLDSADFECSLCMR